MTIPEDAPKPIFEYQWKFEVDGQEKIITTNGDYPKVDGEFIGVETEEIQAGYEAPIHDFSMERGGTDYTETFLEEDHLIVVIAYSLSNAEMDGFIPVREVTNEALKKGYKVIGLSASSEEVTAQLVEQYELNFDFYFCDMTTLKTIVRSNPGLLELQNGTIMQKLHWNDADELQLEELPEAKPELNVGLKQRLDSIAVLDQKYRSLMQIEDEATRSAKAVEMGLESTMTNEAIWKLQQVIDSANMAFVERLFVTEGYPGKSVVGEPTNKVAWYVLQHNPDKIETYLPLIKKAGEAGELPFSLVAMMEDRYLMNQGKPQVYGTQGRTDESGSYIWPIKDPETVNDRRLAIGYTQTVEEYAKDLFGSDFIYEVRTIDELKH